MLRGLRTYYHLLRRDIVFRPTLDARRREHGIFLLAAQLQTYARFAADHCAGTIRSLSRVTLAGYLALPRRRSVPRAPYSWSRQRCRGLFEAPCTGG